MQKSQDFHPSALECVMAKDVFTQAYLEHSHSSNKTLAARCALDAVWEAARRYQAQLEADEREYQRLLKESKRMKIVARKLKEVAV